MFNKIKELILTVWYAITNPKGKFNMYSENGKNYLVKNGKTTEISSEEVKQIMRDSKITTLSVTENNVSYIHQLWDVWNKHKAKGTSEFGERVILKTNYFKSTMAFDGEKGNYFGDIQFEFEVIGERTKNEHYTYTGKLHEFNCPIDFTEKHLRSLLVLALSGCYATPYDFDNFYQTIFQFTQQEPPADLYKCSVCDTPFATVDELLVHMKETKHNDNITEWLPHYNYFVA